MGLRPDPYAFEPCKLSRRSELGSRHGAPFLLALILLASFQSVGAQSLDELEQRGVKAFQERDFAAAERLFSELVRQKPSPMAFSYLATTEGAMGKYGEAIAHFRKSIELRNDTPLIRYNVALSYEKDNQLELAIAEFKSALAKDPKLTDARYALGVALLQAGSHTKHR